MKVIAYCGYCKHPGNMTLADIQQKQCVEKRCTRIAWVSKRYKQLANQYKLGEITDVELYQGWYWIESDNAP